jgi:hypothetical protein
MGEGRGRLGILILGWVLAGTKWGRRPWIVFKDQKLGEGAMFASMRSTHK